MISELSIPMPFRENNRTTTLEIIGRLSDSEILGKLNKQVVTPKFGTPLERSAALFRLLVDTPVRPPGDSRIWKWTNEELESELKRTFKGVDKWCVGKAAPQKAEHFLPVFVGEGGADESEQWRELRTRIEEIWRLAREYQRAEGRRKRAANRASRASVSVASPDEAPDTPNIVEPSLQSWGVERARIDVASRVGDLPETIYGRAEECDRLDRFLECNERGLTIVTGPAGSGKSALLAHWLRHRQGAGDLVVRHFVTREFRGTTDPLDMLQHLLFQLAQNGIGVRPREAFNHTSVNAALDDLVRALKQTPSKRLIVAIDGLDELDSRLPDHFVRETLAQNIFVIVSCRASEGEEPPYLSPWMAIAKRGIAIEPIKLNGLDAIGVESWYRERFDLNRTVSDTRAQDIIAKLHRLTGGLPLALRHVLADERFVARDADIASLTIERLPSSFYEYVRQEFDRFVEELRREWTRPIRLSLALLTKILAPISTVEMRAFLRHLSSEDGSFAEVPELNYIDDKLRRWLSVQMIDGRRCFSLTHSRFAETFSKIMEIECADIDAIFVPWLELAWRSAEEAGSKNVASYALDWLPAHLANGDKEHRRRAARLLSSPVFVETQMSDPRYALRRLRSSLDAWSDWNLQSECEPTVAMEWTAFWAENEKRVIAAINVGLRHRYPIKEIVSRSLGDRLVRGADISAPSPLALAPASLANRALARSIDDTDLIVLADIVVLSDRIAALGRFGGIHFWTHGGSRLTGEFDPSANSGSDTGHLYYERLISIGGNFISWTSSGEIEFWRPDGQKIDGVRGHAHQQGVDGALCLGQSVVTWGGSSLRFWTLEGRLMAASDEDDHRYEIKNVLELSDRVVSWDKNGWIRFWTKTGERLKGGGRAAHMDGLAGFIECEDRLLSWGKGGGVRNWTLAGSPMHIRGSYPVVGAGSKIVCVHGRLFIWRGTGKLYSCDISGNDFQIVDDSERRRDGIVQIHDVLIDWGDDGIIFRSIDGNRLAGSHQWNAPIIGVSGTEKYVVSWGNKEFQVWTHDGALIGSNSDYVRSAWILHDRVLTWGAGLRLWSMDAAAYDTQPSIEGVLTIDNGFVSWGDDGSVLFWSLAGGRLVGGDERAHKNPVICAIAFGDRVMSWSDESGCRLWSTSGAAYSAEEELRFDLQNGVAEIQRWGNGLVSRGNAGLRFWDELGYEQEETRRRPQQDVEGFVIVDEKLIAWRQNELHFWDEHRSKVSTVDRAHGGDIWDVLVVGEKVLSWESAGILKIWSCIGELEQVVDTGIAPLNGVVRGPSHLLCYGDANVAVVILHNMFVVGVVEFDGRPSGSGMLALESAFVGLDIDYLQLWVIGPQSTLTLTKMQHVGVMGVLAVQEYLVSWGKDGAIRFWKLDGGSLGIDIENAHAFGRVFDVVCFGDLLVSHGSDGIICVWRLNATLVRVIVPPGGARSVRVVNDCVVVFGESLWVYSRQELLAVD